MLNKKIESYIARFRSSDFMGQDEIRIFTESIIRNQNYIQAFVCLWPVVFENAK
jgi:hypothetical protein